MFYLRTKKFSLTYIIKRYIQEFIEAFIAYTIYEIISSKKFVLCKTIQMSFIIGFITFILEEYNASYKNSLKNGIVITLGSQLLKY